MLEAVLLGIIQGVSEWLPVSSEGLIVLARVNFFGAEEGIEALIRYALFLHLGTFLAALIYFFGDVKRIVVGAFRYLNTDGETRKLVNFLAVSTIASGATAFSVLQAVGTLEERFAPTGKGITAAIGVLLLVTAAFQFKKNGGVRRVKDSGLWDSVLVGVLQGFSVLPGISRSGITVATLLLRKYDDTESLRLSFLMSLPVVLGGNVLLNFTRGAVPTNANITALFFAFALGLLTIHFLMKVAERVKFGWFVLAFGVLTIASVFV